MKQYKVIIWGLGNVGRYVTKMIAQTQSLKLVGVVDTDPAKVGKDVGEIFGFGKMGVEVSDDIDATLKMEADIVLDYLPSMRDEGVTRPTGYTPNAENICLALKAKKNVLTTLPMYHLHKVAPKLYDMIHSCALENGVTFTQQGIFPGLFNPYLPLVFSSMTGGLKKIVVNGGQDDAFNTSPWVKVFGYGLEPKDFNGQFLKEIITSYYGSTAKVIADYAGIEYDDYKESHEIYTADTELNPPCGQVMPDTISAHKFSMQCLKDGEEVTAFHFIHKVCDDIQKTPAMSDSYHIEGDIVLDIDIKGMIPENEPYASSGAPGVNLIPQVVEAAPGIMDAINLPASKPVL